jgi:hypothetical protein
VSITVSPTFNARAISITHAPEPGIGILLTTGLLGTSCYWWRSGGRILLGGVS